MAHQSLDDSEILNVRWATVDPNPMAQAREARSIEEQAAEAVRRALPDEFVAEIEGRDPEAKKRKRIESSMGLQGYEAPDEVWYARSLGTGDRNALNPNGDSEGTEMIENSGSVGLQEEKNSGILGGSTLAALKGYSAQSGSGGMITVSGKHSTSATPLVAYGSDDDSD